MAMKKEQIIKALYDANTEASGQIAHDAWLTFYQAASESDKAYLLTEYHKYGEHLFEKSKLSRLEMKEVMAEVEAIKLAESQHQ